MRARARVELSSRGSRVGRSPGVPTTDSEHPLAFGIPRGYDRGMTATPALATAPADLARLDAIRRAAARLVLHEDAIREDRIRSLGLDPYEFGYAKDSLRERLAAAGTDEDYDNVAGHLEVLHAVEAGDVVTPAVVHDSVDYALDRGDYDPTRRD